MKKSFPIELLELFETQFEREFPIAIEHEGFDYDWNFHVAEGVGILRCNLRDVEGNEEDFEWELHPRNR